MEPTATDESNTLIISDILAWPECELQTGDLVTLTWSVTNTGRETVQNTMIRWSLSSGIEAEREPQHRSLSDSSQEDQDKSQAYDLRPGETRTSFVTARMTDSNESALQDVSVTINDAFGEIASRSLHLKRVGAAEITVSTPETYIVKGEPDRFGLKVEIRNTGSKKDRNVTARFELPDGVNVARRFVDGEFQHRSKTPYEYIALGDLNAGEYRTVGLEIEVTRNAGENDIVIPEILVTSESCGATRIEPMIVSVPKQVDLSSSSISVGIGGEWINSGETVDIIVTITNTGRSAVRDVRCEIDLPNEFTACPGTVRIDGNPDGRRDTQWPAIVSRIPGCGSVKVSLKATLSSPIAHGNELLVRAKINDEEVHPWRGYSKSTAKFLSGSTEILKANPSMIAPGGECVIVVIAHNSGTDEARGTVIRLQAESLIVSSAVLRTADASNIAMLKHTNSSDGSAWLLELGNIAPNESTRVEIHVASPGDEREKKHVSLDVSIKHGHEDWERLGASEVIVSAKPQFSHACEVSTKRTDPLRIGQTRAITARIGNDGEIRMKSPKLHLELPIGLRMKGAQGATLTSDNTVEFPDIEPGSVIQATVGLFVAETLTDIVRIRPSVSADGMTTKKLPETRMTFASTRSITSSTAKIRNEDNQSIVSLDLQNDGDISMHGLVVTLNSSQDVALKSWSLDGKEQSKTATISPVLYGVPIHELRPNERRHIVAHIDRFAPTDKIDFTVLDSSGQEYQFPCRVESESISTITTFEQDKPLSTTPWTNEETDSNLGAKYEEETRQEITHKLDDFNDSTETDTLAPRETQEKSTIAEQLPEKVEIERQSEEDDLLRAREPDGEDNPPPEATQQVKPDEVDLVPREGSAGSQPIDVHGAFATTIYDASRIKKTKTAMQSMAKSETIGWYRHVVTLRLLAPNYIRAESNEKLEQAWEKTFESIQSQTKMPVVKASMPGFVPDQEWANIFSTDEMISSTKTLIEDLPNAISNSTMPSSTDQASHIIDVGFIAEFERDVPVGGGHLNLMLAHLMPTNIPNMPKTSRALESYRTRIITEMEPMLYQGEAARHRSIVGKTESPEILGAYASIITAMAEESK